MKKYTKPELELLEFRTEPVLEDTTHPSAIIGENELPPIFPSSKTNNWFVK